MGKLTGLCRPLVGKWHTPPGHKDLGFDPWVFDLLLCHFTLLAHMAIMQNDVNWHRWFILTTFLFKHIFFITFLMTYVQEANDQVLILLHSINLNDTIILTTYQQSDWMIQKSYGYVLTGCGHIACYPSRHVWMVLVYRLKKY